MSRTLIPASKSTHESTSTKAPVSLGRRVLCFPNFPSRPYPLVARPRLDFVYHYISCLFVLGICCNVSDMSSSERGQDKSLKRSLFHRNRKERASPQSTIEHDPRGSMESPDMGSESRSAISDICDGLITVLGVTKEASAAFPPLQSAAGGLLEVCKVFRVRAKCNREILGHTHSHLAENGFKCRRSEGVEGIC